MNATQTFGFDTGGATSAIGQTHYRAFLLLTASNQFSVTVGNALSYIVTTDVPNGAGQVVVASEEDLADIVESDRAMAEARRLGTKSWPQVRKELGL